MFDTIPTLHCAGRTLRLDRPLVMGILNVTPDSFADGGLYVSVEAAVAHGLRLIAEGADIIDIGGKSNSPGAEPVSLEDELLRVMPVINALAAHGNAVISIDTCKPEVMRAAVAAGAGLINDIYALRMPGALEAAAELAVPVVLMHMKGEPQSMQQAPQYDNVVDEVHRFLVERLFAAEMAGIERHRLLVDPGFGFGKTTAHNIALLTALEHFTKLGVPLLVGWSRKSSLGELTGRQLPTERVYASVAAHLIAVQHGALIVRVHDVAAMVDALKVWQAVSAASVPTPRTQTTATCY
ncbi:dihydropteroate synthase [Xylella taiwanensis]|uniref:Dihydropteroate synthase n=1 Tax=Xylella taiwanensis TaxID=1444770 RepID=Z9JHM2_9GAMM|nr:dihydropteroate synthase [Xylella taiwanensis]AXI82541.1 dihydropteroate synthase [Xylella taiwanensis]EWS77669.1 dihydropteroate synthase [Xylella taiwanensis]MCD8455530.1 dihydropteroate synthase [Xylella taiwanensis]MCD8457938.1 dihydropteroate synthase [Xylella taiwanensis]MCD8460072.1 dihydropteroate synthase [Xylella taiwanensis]